MTDFHSRAVRSLLELHEQEMFRFLEVWEQFVASKIPLPEGRGDPDYGDHDHLFAHVVTAARSYIEWIGEVVKRPAKHVDAERDPRAIAMRGRDFVRTILDVWRRTLASVTDDELNILHATKWGVDFVVEAMLEHAVVHPMRHRIQLERILDGPS